MVVPSFFRSDVIALVAALLGVILIVARIWMRFITTHREFSWEGTLIIVFAPLAIIRTGWNRWLRLLMGVLALILGVFVAFTPFSDLSLIRATIGVGWFALIYAILVWAASFSVASRHDPRFTHVVRDGSAHAGASRPGLP